MSKLLLSLFFFTTINANAADFLIQLTPAPNSVTNSQVADDSLSPSKITNLQTILDSKTNATSLGTFAFKSSLLDSDIPLLSVSKITNLQTILDSKADGSLLGSMALKSSLAESDIPSLSISKVTNLQTSLDAKANSSSLGSLASKSSLVASDIPSITSSKISDFTTAVQALITAAFNNYVLKTDLKEPTTITLKTGTNQTYTPSANVAYIKVRMLGGGGGGSASFCTAGISSATYFGANGGNTVFGSYTALGGQSGKYVSGGPGGLASSISGEVIYSSTGGAGQSGILVAGGSSWRPTYATGTMGGSSALAGGVSCNVDEIVNAPANTGVGGGGGAGTDISTLYNPASNGAGNINSTTCAQANAGGIQLGSSGGAGAYVELLIKKSNLASSYTYTIGNGGAGGGTTGANAMMNGGAGGSGVIIIEEHYQ